MEGLGANSIVYHLPHPLSPGPLQFYIRIISINRKNLNISTIRSDYEYRISKETNGII